MERTVTVSLVSLIKIMIVIIRRNAAFIDHLLIKCWNYWLIVMHNAIHNVIYVNNRRRVEVLYEPIKGQHVV